jgi:hypothetical protein
MSYNVSKGDQKVGDLVFEDDSDTKIDFSANSISLTAGGETQLTVKPEGVLRLNTSIDEDTGRGEIVTFGTGSSFTTGKVYHFYTSGAWDLVDADEAVDSSQLLGIALGSTPSSGMLLRGFFHADDIGVTNFSTGRPIYLSTTAGVLSTNPPTDSGEIVRVVGYCTDVSNVIYFDPSQDWLELGDPGVGSGGDWADALSTGASLDGVASLEVQAAAPANTSDYAKLLTMNAGDAQTALLYHFDGPNNSSYLTDFGKFAMNAWMRSNDTVISTTQSKWGGSSLKLLNASAAYGSYDYVYIPQSYWSPPWHSFTVEFWVYVTAFTAAGSSVISQIPDENSGAGGWYIIINSSGTVSLGKTGGSALTTTGTVSANTWTHVAASLTTTYPSGTPTFLTEIYIGGTRSVDDTETNSHSYFADTQQAPLRIGWHAYSGTNYYLQGYLDDLRVSTTARYTGSSVSVPSAQLGTNAALFAQSENGEMRRIS